jgi:hypothetical protein
MSRVISVQGTGRCGTSVTAALLTDLGISIDAELVEAAPMNPRGFFEPKRAVELNELLRKTLGFVDSVPGDWRPTTEQAPAFAAVVDEIERYVAEQREAHDLLVLKDPRLARLLWAWEPSLTRHFDEHLVVIVHRGAPGVVASYVRNGRTPEEAAMVWVLRTLGYERGTRHLPRVWIRFEDLLAEPEVTFRGVTDFLGMAPAAPAVFERIDVGMNHAADRDATPIPDALASLVGEVEAILAAGPEPDGDRLDAISARLAEEAGR